MAGLFFTSSNKLAYTWDADALAYLAACGIPNDSTIYYLGTPQQRTGAQISTYLNDMVLSLKAANLWSKFSALYPFLGGTATTHKFNLINPANTDSAFRLSFAGGITHSATGALPNGSNGYANTHFIPSNNLTRFSSHLAFYSRTDASGGDDFSVIQDALNGMRIIIKALSYSVIDMYSIGNGRLIVDPIESSTGLFTVTRTSDVSLKYFKNNNIAASTNVQETGDLPNLPISLFALNITGALGNYSNRECAFASIGDGLTDSETADLYNIVQSFQTSLGRQV